MCLLPSSSTSLLSLVSPSLAPTPPTPPVTPVPVKAPTSTPHVGNPIHTPLNQTIKELVVGYRVVPPKQEWGSPAPAVSCSCSTRDARERDMRRRGADNVSDSANWPTTPFFNADANKCEWTSVEIYV
ncbi:hypothetical protein CVT25_014034 [Psilocybe cyanescens]|uniref:Uncharacterized protein n=1 Tax=Psilocybe cyanescens TaxID=93625 RepID=A0A409XJX6_PSICY|nr:hypothetical protein CVT25_014034 [Psilocybe cyanescens]